MSGICGGEISTVATRRVTPGDARSVDRGPRLPSSHCNAIEGGVESITQSAARATAVNQITLCPWSGRFLAFSAAFRLDNYLLTPVISLCL
jgi:hypothetical protein